MNGICTMNLRMQACKALCFACFLFATIVNILPIKGYAADFDPAYMNSLIAESRDRGISNHRYWDLLLYYRKVGENRESTANDPKFFLSENGKSDPQAELEETLRSFFEPNIENHENKRCRFVARYAWLKEQLQIDESKLAPVVCTEFEQSLSDINPKSVTLIFPVAYLNSPASMFGHTLLRIDGSSESALISLAVNYSAVTSENQGLIYAYKGVSGGFQGYYATNPYYEKVREYIGIEHRDIWEYRLDLTQEETKRLFYHVWEMRGIGSNYYFLDRNCSYAILYLLEIARPSLKNINDFLEDHKVWVLPSDTVRVVIDSGIVAQVSYRPSLVTRIKDMSNLLSDENRQIAYSMSTGAAPPTAVGAIFWIGRAHV